MTDIPMTPDTAITLADPSAAFPIAPSQYAEITRLQEARVPGQATTDSTGALRWVLPDGVELTPKEAAACFLNSTPDGHRQIVDRTETGPDAYWIGGPCGRNGSFGTQGARLYHRWRTTEGWTYDSEPSPQDAELLRQYLTGPRPVRVVISRRDWYSRPGYEDVLDAETVVHDAPDPDDYTAWTAWLGDYAKAWMSRQNSLQPGDYSAHAVDPRAARCSGFQGLASLSLTVDLGSITQ
ncbi:hypothetical protein ACFXJO_16220 [Streptomyces lavendulae]|uniref:hypothetical protein n=1 Tax=Streptomyces lavendulae TaxID=1914 RepID=UPI00368C2ECE